MNKWHLVLGFYGTIELLETHEKKADAVWSAKCWQDGNACGSKKGGNGIYHVGRYSVVRGDVLSRILEE